jgi:hypothetical protein
MKGVLLTLAAAALLAGCSTTGQLSYLDGRRFYVHELYTYDTAIASVDGLSTLMIPVPVEPGRRVIELRAPALPGFTYGTRKTIELDVEPCKRYHLMAVRENALAQDWTPAVNYVADIGCWPKK